MRYLRMARRLLVACVIAGLVALNVATLTLSSVFGALSGLVEMLDVPTVQASQKAEAARLNRERRQAVAARDRAQAEARTAKAARARARGEARIARGQRDSARQSVQVQKAHLHRIRTDFAAIGAELRQTAARLGALTLAIGTQVDDLSRSIGKRTVTRVSRSLATLPARVIPFAGIAVTVGFTAWDAAEACESLRDMAAMRDALDLAPDPEGSETTVCGQAIPTEQELGGMLAGSADERVAACKRFAGPFDIEARDECEALREVETDRTADGGTLVKIGPACIGPTCGPD